MELEKQITNPAPLALTLEVRVSFPIIEKLVDNGSTIMSYAIQAYNQYPQYTDLARNLFSDYTKVLYNENIPPALMLGTLKYVKPPDQVVEFILQKMEGYLKQDKWVNEWRESRWEAEFWNESSSS